MSFDKAWDVRKEKESPLLQILCVKVRTSYSQCLVLICLQLMNIETFISVYFAHCSFSVLDIN